MKRDIRLIEWTRSNGAVCMGGVKGVETGGWPTQGLSLKIVMQAGGTADKGLLEHSLDTAAHKEDMVVFLCGDGARIPVVVGEREEHEATVRWGCRLEASHLAEAGGFPPPDILYLKRFTLHSIDYCAIHFDIEIRITPRNPKEQFSQSYVHLRQIGSNRLFFDPGNRGIMFCNSYEPDLRFEDVVDKILPYFRGDDGKTGCLYINDGNVFEAVYIPAERITRITISDIKEA